MMAGGATEKWPQLQARLACLDTTLHRSNSYWNPGSSVETPLGRTLHSTRGGPWLTGGGHTSFGKHPDYAQLVKLAHAHDVLNLWDLAWYGCTASDREPSSLHSRTCSSTGLDSPYLRGCSPPPPEHDAATFPRQTHSHPSPHASTASLQHSDTSNGNGTTTKSSSHGSQAGHQQRSPATASPGDQTPAPAVQTKCISLPHDLPSELTASVQISSDDSSQQGRPQRAGAAALMQPSLPQDPQAHTGASPTLPINALMQQGKAAASGDVQGGLLGTWVHRQYRLLDPIQEPPQANSIANAASYTTGPSSQHLPALSSDVALEQLHASSQNMQQGSAVAAAAAMAHTAGLCMSSTQPVDTQGHNTGEQLQGRVSESGSTDRAAEAAWRWRFVRRWHAEQQRATTAEPSTSMDKTEEALAYLQAGGGQGWSMQVGIARTQSTETVSALQSVNTQALGSLLASELLLDDGSYTHTGVLTRASGDTATKHVNSINRRAMQLLEQQVQLERMADERWATLQANRQENGGEAWVGHHLATVEIDDWGTFRFLVLRVQGRHDRQRILVRGRNYCSEGQITEEMNRKIIQLAQQTGCPVESVEVMGGGVMEWRRERDRHLHLHAGWAVSPGLDPSCRLTCGQELLNLGAVLTKQHLPVHFKVTIEGQ